jgi:ATP-dependent Zn protease
MTVQLEDPTLIPELEAAGVQFQGRIESHWLRTLLSWIVPALVFVAIWGFFMRRMGPASRIMSIGKSKAKVYVAQTTGVTFDDVAGINEACAELLDRLDVFLGGRTAEEIIFGEVSTGAQDDLQCATDLVRHMITRYGMGDALGLATFEAPQHALFLQGPTGAPRAYSEEPARVIDAEIQMLLQATHPDTSVVV